MICSMEGEEAPLMGRAGHARTYRHHVPIKSKFRTRLALAAVLLTETFERIAFYGIVGNLVMFLNTSPFEWRFYNATNAMFVFTGLSYMWSLIGGWIADSFLGKFRTIILFFVIYISGFVFFPLLYPYPKTSTNTTAPSWCSSVKSAAIVNGSNVSLAKTSEWLPIKPPEHQATETCSWAVYLALSLIAIGNGPVKANISPFGADQVKHEGPAAIRMFVNWFYWCINIGALISLGGLAYLQQEISFFWGYVAPSISLVIATLVFVAGVCTYEKKPARGSILTNIVKILHQACTRSCRKRPRTYGLVSGAPELYTDIPSSCLDYAKIQYGGSYHDNMVDDVKKLGKICVIFMAMIPYWVVYFQMETTFLVQGLHMRLDFDDNNTKAAAEERNFKIPAAWLSLFDVIFLVILLPIFDRIYPVLDRRGYMLTPRLRIVIGMMFSMAAVAAAGLVEMYRLHIYWRGGEEHVHWQLIGETFYRASDVTILLQIPQYALIGVSEVFASVAGLELAYVLAPKSMQGLITGLFWFTQGLGSVLGTVIIYGFHGTWFFSWDYGDINCHNQKCGTDLDPERVCSCHMDYYFFFLAGLQAVGVVIFAVIAWKLDVGLQSAYRRKPAPSEDCSPIVNDSHEGGNRPGYRTFGRRHDGNQVRHVNVPVRANSQVSESDTLDTDYTSDIH